MIRIFRWVILLYLLIIYIFPFLFIVAEQFGYYKLELFYKL